MKPSKDLLEILNPAFDPCQCFSNACSSMTWAPKEGHVPRGFLGATDGVIPVKLVIVFAEPGDPHTGEIHESISTVIEKTYDSFSNGLDVFHRNVRYILDGFFPGMSFDEQLKCTWITESVLCSAQIECGPVSKRVSQTCVEKYLLPQLKLFPEATILALGNKAQRRLKSAGINGFLRAAHPAAPGGNRKVARESWDLVASAYKSKNTIT